VAAVAAGTMVAVVVVADRTLAVVVPLTAVAAITNSEII